VLVVTSAVSGIENPARDSAGNAATAVAISQERQEIPDEPAATGAGEILQVGFKSETCPELASIHHWRN
jgi:hypothetical protein